MSTSDMILAAIGFVVVGWFLFGFAWFLFGMKVLIPPSPWHPPLKHKVFFVLEAGFALPWYMLTTGHAPRIAAMMPEWLTGEEFEAFDRWRKANCPCDKCRSQRGEA